jgi:hypothetical protein
MTMKQKIGYFMLGIAVTLVSLFALHPPKAIAQQGSVSIRRADMTKANLNSVPSLGAAFAMSCVSDQGREQCFVAFR